MTVKCLAQEHNTMSPTMARTESLDPVSNEQAMRQKRLPHSHNVINNDYILINCSV